MVTAEQVPACELPQDSGRFDLTALGDFDASPHTSDSVTRDQRGVPLAFPLSTRAVKGTAQFSKSSEQFAASAEYSGGPALPLLFWPLGRTCKLSDGDTYLTPGGGQGAGYSPALSLVLFAGSNAAQSGSVTGALTFDAGVGEVITLPPGNAQLSEPRAFASVTPIDGGFLVAGGEDPTVTFPSGKRRLRRSAEVYVASEHRFDPERLIPLIYPRSRHVAFAVPTGQTLLVGGRTASDAGEEQALDQLELLDATLGRSTRVGVLAEARVAPNAVALSDGSFFVSGGYDLQGRFLPSAEWVRPGPNGTYHGEPLQDTDFVARIDQALVAMPGARVLAVGGCQPGDSGQGDCGGCRSGCAPSDGWDAFWITPHAEVARFQLDVAVPSPVLIPAPDAAPFLVQGSPGGASATSAGALYRFDPWQQLFVPSGDLEWPPAPDLPLVSLDRGLSLWLSEAEGQVVLAGRRFSTRGRFAQDLELVTQVSPSNVRWPLHLSPGQGTALGSEPRAALVPPDDPTAGRRFVLELKGPSSVWITDTDYADFRLEVDLAQGSLPQLYLGPEVRCSWPGKRGDDLPETLSATRRGPRLVLERTGAPLEQRECSTPTNARVSVGLAIDDESCQVRQIRISREPD